MLEKIKSTLSDHEFQRNAAQAVGGFASMLLTVAISTTVSKLIGDGIDAVMDKIQNKTESPAE
jgi:hypothetical protein